MQMRHTDMRILLRGHERRYCASIWTIFTLFVILSGQVSGANPKPSYTVREITAEYVYLQGGRSDGLAVGDRFVVRKGDSVVVELELVFLSDHSAACKIVLAVGAITPGLKVQLVTGNAANDTTKSLLVDSLPVVIAEKPQPPPAAIAPRVKPDISGSVSLTYDSWIDNANQRLNFSQSTVRLSLRARKIAGKEMTFSVRSRGRYDQRSRAFNYSVPQKSWANHIYELSLSYDDKTAPINFSVGRAPVRRVGSIGYIDGVTFDFRMYGPFRTGLYLGAMPKWQYSATDLSLQKYGCYVNFTQGSYRTALFEMTLAGAGEYHRATTSREMLCSQINFSLGNRWSISEASEFDINRGWRRVRSGSAIAISSAYLDTRIRFTNWLSTGLSYDNRRNYWTYEQRTLADSLFDDHLNRGVRSRFDIRLPGNFLTGFSVGYRKRSGDPEPTYSYTASLNKSGLALAKSSLSLQYSSFSGPQQNGSNLSSRISEYFHQRDYFSLGYGFYRYNSIGGNASRLNHWIESTIWVDIFKNFFLNGMYQFNAGDDLKGHRLQLEFGCLL